MMGDNRDNSNDSRFIGTVKLEKIVGRSSYVINRLEELPGKISINPSSTSLPAVVADLSCQALRSTPDAPTIT